MKIIDAHQHYWQVARGDYHWMPDSGVLRNDYLPSDLSPVRRASNVEGTVTVQAAQTTAESDFLIALADQPDSGILGVVGWVPLDSPHAEEMLESLAVNPVVVGVRPMLHDLADERWITNTAVVGALRKLHRLDLRLDLLTYPKHLQHVYKALGALSDIPVVVDHLSKPRYRDGMDGEWRRWMSTLASHDNVYCKLSGMVTEVGADWVVEDFKEHAQFVLEHFGTERVMFGSDWPVCLQVATYEQVVELTERLVNGFSPSERENVWRNTARRFYGL